MKGDKRRKRNLAFEDFLGNEWTGRAEPVEVSLGNRAVLLVGAFVVLLGLCILGRLVILGSSHASFEAQAQGNATNVRSLPAPRGVVYDAQGEVLAGNEPSFFLLLDLKAFEEELPEGKERTLRALEEVVGIPKEEIEERIASVKGSPSPLLLGSDLLQHDIIELKSLGLESLLFNKGFRRVYPQGEALSPVLGYTGAATKEDLENNPALPVDVVIGKAGIESVYDELLRGTPGASSEFQNAKGETLTAPRFEDPVQGEELHLTIDAEFQKYFHARLGEGLSSLGLSMGVGLALDPRDGSIRALVTLPSYDNNLFSSSGRNEEKQKLLASKEKPFFNRAISGLYAPGSTIKPLHALASLAEEVIGPDVRIFSPGYLDIPNPYEKDKPTRFLDWRPQGWVAIRSALAQSSNVYFYIAGGGVPPRAPVHEIVEGGTRIKGLGISRLHAWWEKFGLGTKTGIDLRGEAEGLLPSPELKEERGGTSWLLGDTYNVSIGQGDLLLTPLQILNYIATIAEGGVSYVPHVKKTASPEVARDLRKWSEDLKIVEEGMMQTVTSPQGTARLLGDLPFTVAAKTGSAQVFNKTQENAFFVGYIIEENGVSPLAILVLVENAREGSLNAVPIAKDVLSWYYTNRL